MTASSESTDLHIQRLGRLVEEALTTVGAMPGAGYALADFPFHNNTGDSAIWLGEVEALRRLTGRGAVYVSDRLSDPAEIGRFVSENDIIFLHGGGNFGDIWPAHQAYREAIIARYPKNRIVQLPQSVHYKSEEALARSRAVLSAHPDLTLMVRDHASLAFVQEQFDCTALLVPDAAFCIRTLTAPRRPAKHKLACLLRQDIEKRADADASTALFEQTHAGAHFEDWRDFPQAHWTRAHNVMRVLRRLPTHPVTMGWRRWWLDRKARQLVALGLAQLAEAEIVVTDRLHGHILSTLAHRPHVTIDNFYGKITNFCAAWGTDHQTRLAKDYAEAAHLAKDLGAARTAA